MIGFPYRTSCNVPRKIDESRKEELPLMRAMRVHAELLRRMDKARREGRTMSAHELRVE